MIVLFQILSTPFEKNSGYAAGPNDAALAVISQLSVNLYSKFFYLSLAYKGCTMVFEIREKALIWNEDNRSNPIDPWCE